MHEEVLGEVEEGSQEEVVPQVDKVEFFLECYKSHKLGHYQSEYPSWEENANYVEFNEEEWMIFMAKR